MLKSLALISKKTLVATATSLTMVGTAGAALGTTITTQEAVPADSTIVDTTLVDTTVVDTTIVDTTFVDTTLVDTTLVDTTLVDTTLADEDEGENGLCEAWEKAAEHGKSKNTSNPAWSGLLDEAAAAGLSVDDFCDGVLGEKHSNDAADDDAATPTATTSPKGGHHGSDDADEAEDEVEDEIDG